MSTIPLCVATRGGDFQGCGAELKHDGSDQQHLDHGSDCSKRYCVGCGTATGSHYPGCTWPEEA